MDCVYVQTKGGTIMEQDFQKTANRVTSVSIIGNLVLSAFKFVAGVVANSGAMISDAVHSASDVFSSIVVIIGILFILIALGYQAKNPIRNIRTVMNVWNVLPPSSWQRSSVSPVYRLVSLQYGPFLPETISTLRYPEFSHW